MNPFVNTAIADATGRTNTATGNVHASDVLETVKRSMQHAHAPLLDPVIRFAGRMPACSGTLLELHLDKKQHPIDYAWRLNKYFDRPLLNRLHVPPACSFLLDEAANKFADGLENIWIEHDHPFDEKPALFFDLQRDRPFLPAEAYASLQQITAHLGYRLQPALLQFLERIKAIHLFVIYYGFMFSRKSDYIRLTINGIKPGNLSPVLSRLGWKGNYKAIRNLEATYLHNGQQLVLAVDFNGQLSLRIGIEVFEEEKHAMRLLLHRSKMLCSEHSAVLQTWPGTVLLPAELSQGLSKLHHRNIGCLYKRISHFKFIVTDRERTAAKAYLYYCF